MGEPSVYYIVVYYSYGRHICYMGGYVLFIVGHGEPNTARVM